MLERITFENHLGEKIQFGTGGIFANYNELRDFKWDYTEKNNRIMSFKRSVIEKKLPVLIFCQSAEEGIQKKNHLMELMEKDILSLQSGRMIINEYYLKCYITASEKSDYLIHEGYLKAELTVTTDYPFWIKESTSAYGKDGEGLPGKNLDYPYDFAFDFQSGSKHQGTLQNNGFSESDFEITVYGPCENPGIIINSVLYRVNADISVGEYLKINSLTKKIYKKKYDGEIVNLFNMRERESYIFTKIQPGRSAVLWDADFSFDITVIEKRSEPKWT